MILLVAILAFALVFAWIIVFSTILVLTGRSSEANPALASSLVMRSCSVVAFAAVLALLVFAQLNFASLARKSMTTSTVGFRRAWRARATIQALVLWSAQLSLTVGTSEASVTDAVSARMLFGARMALTIRSAICFSFKIYKYNENFYFIIFFFF